MTRRQRRQRLQQQRRLADAGIAADQHDAAFDQAAAEDAVELLDARATRGISRACTSPSDCTGAVGASAGVAVLARRLDPRLSTMQFHALQCGHWPCHFKLVPPHSEQTNWVRAFAISVTRLRLPAPAVRARTSTRTRRCRSASATSSIGKPAAPQFDCAADVGCRCGGQIDGDHVHRHASRNRHACAVDHHRRAIGRMARIAVRIATGDDPDPHRARGDEAGAIADGIAGLRASARRSAATSKSSPVLPRVRSRCATRQLRRRTAQCRGAPMRRPTAGAKTAPPNWRGCAARAILPATLSKRCELFRHLGRPAVGVARSALAKCIRPSADARPHTPAADRRLRLRHQRESEPIHAGIELQVDIDRRATVLHFPASRSALRHAPLASDPSCRLPCRSRASKHPSAAESGSSIPRRERAALRRRSSSARPSASEKPAPRASSPCPYAFALTTAQTERPRAAARASREVVPHCGEIDRCADRTWHWNQMLN